MTYPHSGDSPSGMDLWAQDLQQGLMFGLMNPARAMSSSIHHLVNWGVLCLDSLAYPHAVRSIGLVVHKDGRLALADHVEANAEVRSVTIYPRSWPLASYYPLPFTPLPLPFAPLPWPLSFPFIFARPLFILERKTPCCGRG